MKRCLAGGSPVILVDTKKKRDHRQLPQCWPAVASSETAQEGSWSRLSHSRGSACLSLWHLRHWAQHRFRQCRNRSRHRSVCRGLHPGVVAPRKALYADAATILITADGGGSNGWRLRLWKLELQRFADETGLPISVCHFPAGTSKWNKIEHRLFSFISSNWRGEPLRDYATVVKLIVKTTTAKGLKVTCRLDRRKYPTGRKVTNEEMKRINLSFA